MGQPTSHQAVLTWVQRTHALPTLASKVTWATRQGGPFSQLAWQTGQSAVVKVPLLFELVKIQLGMRTVVERDLSDAYTNTFFQPTFRSSSVDTNFLVQRYVADGVGLCRCA